MLIDSLELFDPAGTAITATAVSTNVIDVAGTAIPASPQGRDLAIGTDLKVRVAIGTTFTAAGAATLQVQVQAAPDNAGVPGTYVILSQTDVIPKTKLVAGAYIDMNLNPLPPQGETLPPNEALANVPRFYRLNYVVATGPFTAGTVMSFLVGESNTDNSIQYGNNYVAV